ncbi:MAG: hypothetical protein ABI887_05870 [Burkholderiales bacterium]
MQKHSLKRELLRTCASWLVVGALDAKPKATDPATGEVSCSFTPKNGPSFVEISLHDGQLTEWRQRNGGKSAVPVPEFGADAFVIPDFEGWADLYVRKGSLIVRVTIPKGPTSIEMTKAVARKALMRL